ncbi:hypothetical protein ACH492_12730 [Streptomyces sp. NPDC019443]|uniref:hypothetical protein n=1 Tax=Streptomyces sp. NPDC019443 TaxID=3365061 RepID=UPI0037A2C261
MNAAPAPALAGYAAAVGFAAPRILLRSTWPHRAPALAAAAARAPKGAFGAGGHPALLRMQRILIPRRCPHPALCCSVAAMAAAAPLLPLLVACPPGL